MVAGSIAETLGIVETLGLLETGFARVLVERSVAAVHLFVMAIRSSVMVKQSQCVRLSSEPQVRDQYPAQAPARQPDPVAQGYLHWTCSHSDPASSPRHTSAAARAYARLETHSGAAAGAAAGKAEAAS